jgi:hypothetical protein
MPRFCVNVNASGFSYFYIEANDQEAANAEAEERVTNILEWLTDFTAQEYEVESVEEDD